MSLGEIKRSRKKVAAAWARSGGWDGKGHHLRRAMIRTWVQRDVKDVNGVGDNYLAGACILGRNNKSARRLVGSRCATPQFGKTPTAAIKKALHSLARKLK